MMAPWCCHAPSYWMMSSVSKGNVLTVEVSWSSLIQGMFSKSLSGVYTWGPVPVVVDEFRSIPSFVVALAPDVEGGG